MKPMRRIFPRKHKIKIKIKIRQINPLGKYSPESINPRSQDQSKGVQTWQVRIWTKAIVLIDSGLGKFGFLARSFSCAYLISYMHNISYIRHAHENKLSNSIRISPSVSPSSISPTLRTSLISLALRNSFNLSPSSQPFLFSQSLPISVSMSPSPSFHPQFNLIFQLLNWNQNTLFNGNPLNSECIMQFELSYNSISSSKFN